MIAAEITSLALELPADQRLDLARKLVESVAVPNSLDKAIEDGIQRIEEIFAGNVEGLTEAEFRAALE